MARLDVKIKRAAWVNLVLKENMSIHIIITVAIIGTHHIEVDATVTSCNIYPCLGLVSKHWAHADSLLTDNSEVQGDVAVARLEGSVERMHELCFPALLLAPDSDSAHNQD